MNASERRTANCCGIAIVSYDPVGQALALSLARRGRSVLVLERWPHLYLRPRDRPGSAIRRAPPRWCPAAPAAAASSQWQLLQFQATGLEAA